jgi:hypothetical protein
LDALFSVVDQVSGAEGAGGGCCSSARVDMAYENDRGALGVALGGVDERWKPDPLARLIDHPAGALSRPLVAMRLE